MFAKLFDTKDYGQICAIQQGADEGGLEVRLFFKPPGLGVCSASLQFKESEAGDDACDKFFDELKEDQAISVIKETYDHFADYANDEDYE